MVNFVGAGPGAADLITVRGQNLLKTADVIIYAGSLVSKEHLDRAKPTCRLYDSAAMTLEEVVGVMESAEAAGLSTVRLHTGDPSIYGAIREQMDLLDQRDIPYSVVPGVSSLFGAAAALRTEYTLPGVSQTVIITRMAGRTPVPERESIAKLSAHGAVMAIFLSAGMLKELRLELLAGGYSPKTPAAIVYKATWPDEEVIRGTVDELPEMAQKSGIHKTSLIIVGEVLSCEYERSRLYHPNFSHEFRQGKEGDKETEKL